MGVAALLLLLAAAVLAGGVALAAVEASPRRPRPELALVAGLVLLHALLLVYDHAGVPWRRLPLALGGAAVVAVALGVARRRGTLPPPPRPRDLAAALARPGWGDAVAAFAVVAYAAAAWTRRITIPDYVYHWGLKAKRFLLAGGIDVAFLADPLRLTDHPDYPSLVPGLYATIGVVRGAFHERAALLVSAAFLAVAVAGARCAAVRAGLGRHAAQGTVAAVALAMAGFGIGYRMAGAADWPIAAALLVALPALLPPGGVAGAAAAEGDRLRLGLAAALAAGAKIEGVPLAALLVAAGLVGWRGGARRTPADLARLLAPPLLVVLPWMALNLRHGLFAAENTGPLDFARLPVALAAAAEAFATREWLGLPWLLVLLPAALAARPARRAAAVLLLQAGFYGWVFLTSPVDTRFLVLSSLPRLLFHLLPPFLVLLAVALLGRSAGDGVAADGLRAPPPPGLRWTAGRRRCRTGRSSTPAC